MPQFVAGTIPAYLVSVLSQTFRERVGDRQVSVLIRSTYLLNFWNNLRKEARFVHAAQISVFAFLTFNILINSFTNAFGRNL